MSNNTTTFALVLGCMDGRCQQKTYALATELFGADAIDTVTEPGMNGILAGKPHPVFPESDMPTVLENIRRKAEISAKGHGSTSCLITAHCECAGNPGELSMHEEDLVRAKETVLGWGLFERVEIAAFDEGWDVSVR